MPVVATQTEPVRSTVPTLRHLRQIAERLRAGLRAVYADRDSLIDLTNAAAGVDEIIADLDSAINCG